MKYIWVIYFCLFLLSTNLNAIETYEVEIRGLKDSAILDAIKSVSSLIALKDHPPRSINALRRRADSDKDKIVQILQAFGYFDANVIFATEELSEKDLKEIIIIDPGIRYNLAQYNIFSTPCKKGIKIPLEMSPSELGIAIDKPISSGEIIQAETNLTQSLSEKGYPLASSIKKDIIVDCAQKNVTVNQCVRLGPLSHFGSITINGTSNIDPKFIAKKIAWKEGDIYDARKVDETQERLLNTQLFSSLLITHGDKVDENGKLPIRINGSEALHKTFSIGASYSTIEEFGGCMTLTNRNFRNMGELLNLEGDLTLKSFTAVTTYVKPDCFKLNQNYVLRLVAKKQKVFPYLAYIYSAENRLDNKLSARMDLSLGIRGEYDRILKSIKDENYTLLSIPLYFKYSSANHAFNPTSGINLSYHPTPYFSVVNEKSFFLKQELIFAFYLPVMPSRLTFAFRNCFVSIVGSSLTAIPMTKLIFGGSDDELRGYRYKSVSPLDNNGDPEGGRAAFFFSFEPRVRVTKTIGIVPFFDSGIVNKKTFPNPNGKWHKSVGIGLRYFTFFGPLRLDVGFPLDRRRFDPKFRIYGSIGQAF